MNKDKLKKLEKYAILLKNKLSDKIPSKHENHPDTYKNFLNNELESVKATIEALKLGAV